MVFLKYRVENSSIERFFREYEHNAAIGDTAASVAQFAPVFLAAGPDGAHSIKTSDFALALPKRKQLFDELGCQSTSLVSLEEIAVDERYVLAKTRWRMEFVHKGGNRSEEDKKSIEASSVFLVDIGQDPFRIVLYLASQDIFAVMRERGILPQETSGPS